MTARDVLEALLLVTALTATELLAFAALLLAGSAAYP